MREPRLTSLARAIVEADAGVYEPLLPSQLDQGRRIHAMQPEVRLALAVLEDAVAALRAAVHVGDRSSEAARREAWAWIASDDTTHPFAFVSVCDHLGLSPAALRVGVRRWRHSLAGTHQSPAMRTCVVTQRRSIRRTSAAGVRIAVPRAARRKRSSRVASLDESGR